MILNRTQLIGLPVSTTHGVALGKVADIAFDTEAQHVLHYEVKLRWQLRRSLGEALPDRMLMINRSQVVRITDVEMVVQDAVIPAVAPSESVLGEAPEPAGQTAPIPREAR